mmetsp:Transcript_807/g.1389  ORF Transcript_807/g.1389 Transcript_807/m.1389 type:complete len:232 (-) Transcript_807:211-906(-)
MCDLGLCSGGPWHVAPGCGHLSTGKQHALRPPGRPHPPPFYSTSDVSPGLEAPPGLAPGPSAAATSCSTPGPCDASGPWWCVVACVHRGCARLGCEGTWCAGGLSGAGGCSPVLDGPKTKRSPGDDCPHACRLVGWGGGGGSPGDGCDGWACSGGTALVRPRDGPQCAAGGERANGDQRDRDDREGAGGRPAPAPGGRAGGAPCGRPSRGAAGCDAADAAGRRPGCHRGEV